MQFLLQSPSKWITGDGCWSRGCALVDGGLVRDSELHKRASTHATAAQAQDFAESAGGFFAVVRCLANGDGWAVVDRGRSIPLFYCIHDGQCLVSDSARLLAARIGPADPEELARIEFMQLCCVSGNDTLHPAIRQLRAGELLRFSSASGTAEVVRYFRYRQAEHTGRSRGELLELGRQALDEAAANLLQYAGDRPIAVPLSGGMDSTLLLASLKLAGCRRLQAYTYGRTNSSEVKHSRLIAADFGVRWDHVPYSPELWRKWYFCDERRRYYEMADNLCTLPHIQDFPAVAELRQSGALAAGTVVASGISVESFYGSPSQPPHPLQSDVGGKVSDGLAAMIVDEKYKLWPRLYDNPDIRLKLEQRVRESIGDLEFHPHTASAYESWFTHEKMSKFYNNSVRAYEFWGLDWWLPLWDKPVIAFWEQVPAPMRRIRAFTEELVTAVCMQASGHVYRSNHFETPVLRGARLLRHVRQHLPFIGSIYQRLKRRLQYDSDPLCWFSLFGRDEVRRLYHSRLSINSLLVLDYLGELAASGSE